MFILTLFSITLLAVGGVVGLTLPELLRRRHAIEIIADYVVDGRGMYQNHSVHILDLETADDDGFRYVLNIDDEYRGFCKSYNQSLRYAYDIIEEME